MECILTKRLLLAQGTHVGADRTIDCAAVNPHPLLRVALDTYELQLGGAWPAGAFEPEYEARVSVYQGIRDTRGHLYTGRRLFMTEYHQWFGVTRIYTPAQGLEFVTGADAIIFRVELKDLHYNGNDPDIRAAALRMRVRPNQPMSRERFEALCAPMDLVYLSPFVEGDASASKFIGPGY